MGLDYLMVPRATYCQPQIANFGYTEAQVRELRYDVKRDARYGELLGART